jgi:plastocyanin
MKEIKLHAQTVSWRPLLAGKILIVLLLTGSAFPALPATVLVQMVNFRFQPQFLTVNTGDTVLWTNTVATTFHNVVSSNNVWAPPALFTSPGTFQFTFTSPGDYGYFCSPHHSFGMTGMITVQGVNQPPTVSLTNPQAGTTFAAPANITLMASATAANGTVTNVDFLSGTSLLGNDTANPFEHVASSLPAGSYTFTARATDNHGLTTTSAAVTVSVVEPGPISFDPSMQANGGRLALRINVTPGLRYAVDYTTNFTGWLPFTNFLATNLVMEFATPTTEDDRRFFQGRLLPNP